MREPVRRMQNRYTGDIGDFVKYALLRALAPDLKVGVAWYLFPDEMHNGDGRHVGYFRSPEKWRERDPVLFDCLSHIVSSRARSVSAIEDSSLLSCPSYASEILDFGKCSVPERRKRRQQWFENVVGALANSELVFADPDNGLCEDENFSYGRVKSWKRLPLSEARALSAGRTAVLYHHNSRRKGGHAQEIDYWLGQLGEGTRALRWRAFSSRTFFVVNPTPSVSERLEAFANAWAPQASVHA